MEDSARDGMNESGGSPGDIHVRLDYARPAPALVPFVFGYHLYQVEAPDGVTHHDVGYPSWANIRFQIDGAPFAVTIGNRHYDPVPHASLFGPTSRAAFLRTSHGLVVGIGLTPLGWTRLIGGGADRYADRITPLGQLFDVDELARSLAGIASIGAAAVLFDAFLTERMARPRRNEPVVAAMQAALVEPEAWSVAALAEALALDSRRLARLSRAHFGFTPKLLLRRARFMRTLLKMVDDEGRPYIDKIDRAYHDQSHFVRDCQYFLSMSPRRFLSMSRPMNSESMRRRRQILGASVQTLHRPGTIPIADDEQPY